MIPSVCPTEFGIGRPEFADMESVDNPFKFAVTACDKLLAENVADS